MRSYLVFGTAALSLLISAISTASVAVAFPVLVTEMNTTLVVAGLVLSIYQLVGVATYPLVGKFSDLIGRKFTFNLCMLLFTVASVLCAIAPNITSLIIFRVIQAAGMGGILPTATGIIADEFPHARQRAVGLMSSIQPAGLLLGPNIGGWIVGAFGWRSVFWFTVPFGIIALILSQVLLKSRAQVQKQTIDFAGAGLLLTSLFSFMFGLTKLGDSASATPWVLFVVLFAVSIVMMMVFLRHEQRVPEPVLEVAILRERPFAASNFYNLFYGMCIMGLPAIIPLFAVSVFGASTFQSGFVLTPRSVTTILFMTSSSFFLVRWGYRRPILLGSAASVLALLLMGLESQGVTAMRFLMGDWAWLLTLMALSGLGMGLVSPAANNACIELMPDRVATITGVRGMFRHMGAAICVAFTTIVVQMVGEPHRAFFIVFMTLGVLMLLAMPAVFLMPAGPNCNVGVRQRASTGH